MSKKAIWWFCIKTVLIALVIAWFLRTFVIESYRIPASSMENTMFEGDRILVSKWSYGLRLPMTPLSLPFFHDSIYLLGTKSYSTALKFPYQRIFASKVTRNDVVLFNRGGDNSDIPIDKQKISIGRCLALPGDSLVFKDDLVFVNGKALTQSPNILEPYFYNIKDDEIINKHLKSLDIPIRDVGKVDSLHVRLLSRYETFLLQQELPKDIQVKAIRPNYNLVVPREGESIRITKENYYVYLPIITECEKFNARFENDSLWINNKYVEHFGFSQNYYWMLPDNRSNYADEATSGFVPAANIIGKAICIWNKGFKKIH